METGRRSFFGKTLGSLLFAWTAKDALAAPRDVPGEYPGFMPVFKAPEGEKITGLTVFRYAGTETLVVATDKGVHAYCPEEKTLHTTWRGQPYELPARY